MEKYRLEFSGSTINEMVEHLYRSGWMRETVSKIGKNLSADQKADIEGYMYLYILEHPNYFERDGKLKPFNEVRYYLAVAIRNQYKDLFRNVNREIVDSDFLSELSHRI